jgi:hypothetical protein
MVAWLPVAGVQAAQVPPAAGNGIWIKPGTTTIPGNEATIVSALTARSIKHVFLWTTTYNSNSYTTLSPFIQRAQASNMTVHALCAVKSMVTNATGLSPTLLQNALNEVLTYNTNHSEAAFDGVQIDVEGVSGSSLLTLVQGVSVPETVVFSAAIQPKEFYSGIESYYASLLQTTDLDLLIPMVYIMDGVYYSGGSNRYTYTVSGLATKTAQLLALLPSQGRMMTGLSAYDLQFGVTKGGGEASGFQCDGASNMAFGTSACAVPQLVPQFPLSDVFYQSSGGLSVYRFDADTTHWIDVLEMTPIGLRQSIASANQGGNGDARYVGTCTWLYHTTFDSTSGKQEGFTADDGVHPSPSIGLTVLRASGGQVRLRVTLTNTTPSERILGAHAAAGVHLQIEGGVFDSADEGSFHAAEAFNAAGALLPSISGAQVLELRRSFFESPTAQQAVSGDIVVSAAAQLTVRYRAWMMDKDSICNDIGTSEPYIARSPNDVHYSDASKFLTYATFTNHIIVSQSSLYAAAVTADWPVAYHRFAETNVVSVPNALSVKNLGTVGTAGNGAPVVTNYGVSTTILGGLSGALATGTNFALKFPGNADTNRISVPFRPEWNVNGPFTVEMWLKGGTNFCCPAASTEYDTRGWLFYQGDSGQTTGNGWYFRVYKTNSVRITAQVDQTVSPGTWYHVAGVYDGTSALLYVNGALADTAALGGTYAPNTNAAYALTFGARSDGGARSYGGLLDEVAFYTNALSASQLAAHYAAASTSAAGYAAHILAHNPAGYWRFDEALNPPKSVNDGIRGSTADGAYLNWSTTVPELQPPSWPGLETTNRVVQVFGTNGQVLIPPLNLNTNTVTFECLIKRNGSQQNYAGLIMHRNADGGGASACGLGFRGTSNHLGYNWNDVAGNYTWDSGVMPPDGQWAYVALAVSASQAALSLCDGTTWRTATHTASHAAQPFAGLTRVGTDGGTNRWFNGLIDEAAIYPVTLSQTQLRAHALAALGNTNQPLFTLVPSSQSVAPGATVNFSAATVGTPTMVYQWQKDGAGLPGTTGASLILTNVDYPSAGQYRVVADNGYGTVTSPAATLVVWPPASVTNLTYRTSGAGPAMTLELIWPSGTLYWADEVTGPWVIVSGAAPPYYQVPISSGAARRFYCTQ